MPYIKLQIAGNIYYTEVEQDQLTNYTEMLNNLLTNPKHNSIVTYDNKDTELEFKQLVFKETALEAYSILN